MLSTVAFQTKGLGSVFHAARNSAIACWRSATRTKTPRRIRFPVRSPNPRSTRFHQMELVGKKWGRKRGCRPSQRLHAGMLVRAVVVHHDMQLQRIRKLFVQPLEKFQELLVALPRIAFSDHFAFSPLQRDNERGRPVALVVVRHRSAATALEGQARRRAIQGLDWALFINAEHQGLGGRIQIQSHPVGQLFQEAGVPGQFEARGAMRFELMTLPDPVDFARSG